MLNRFLIWFTSLLILSDVCYDFNRMDMNKNMSNRELAQLFRALAAALEVQKGDFFRIQAYDQAATAIEHTDVELKNLWQQGKLTQISGIGQGIAKYLDELFSTGKVKHFKKILGAVPESMFPLLAINGVGSKTAFKLVQSLGISKARNAVKKLKQAAQDGEIRVIEGFGEESEKDILRGIKELKKIKTGRWLLSEAFLQAEELVNYLKEDKNTQQVEVLGSLRRRLATIGDIDIAVASQNPAKTIKHFLKFKKIDQILAQGDKKASVVLFNSKQIDLRIQDQATWGSLLQYFTGSKDHNIALRKLAQKKNLSLSEYGIKEIKTGKTSQFNQEKNFYKFLDLDYIPPVLRENTGEIEAAFDHKLPDLVQLKDIKGDLHLHSNFDIETSHDLGKSSVSTLLDKAEKLGYEYLAISDHTPSTSNHSDKQIVEILKRRKAYYEQQIYSSMKIMKNRSIKVFITLEIDILPDGQLTIPDKAFDYLDFAQVSVHSSFHQSRRKVTERIIKALGTHDKIKFLSHPTGRMLNQREGYSLDWDKLFDFCLKNNKFLEVNASPDRLDLADVNIHRAVKAGLKLLINTDSHTVETLDDMKYGVWQAQRGWAEKKHILNSLSLKKLQKSLKIK